jgi:hypothetical protein
MSLKVYCAISADVAPTCLQREAEDAGFKIDHHFPTSKGGAWTVYDNLFLSCDRCNHHKHDWWPRPEEQKQGVRFLNCCQEIDYGALLFENERGEIVCKDNEAAAIYHRRILKLNRPELVRLRLKRRRILEKIEETFFQSDTKFDEASRKIFLVRIELLKGLLEDLIPKIPLPSSPSP